MSYIDNMCCEERKEHERISGRLGLRGHRTPIPVCPYCGKNKQ